MLFLCFFLSCCFSVSMGSAIEEFQENFKALVDLANKELFLQVPGKRFQCSCVHYHLKKTMRQLNTKDYLKNDQMRTHIFLMEKNMDHIIATFQNTRAAPGESHSCPMKEKPLKRAPEHYERFFQRLHENCQKTG